MLKSQRFLVFYSGFLTLVFAATLFSAAAPKATTFDEIFYNDEASELPASDTRGALPGE
jgi:hypothetical protein